MQDLENHICVVKSEENGPHDHDHSAYDKDFGAKSIVLNNATVEGEARDAPLNQESYTR